MVVVADAGMLSATNELDAAHLRFIVSFPDDQAIDLDFAGTGRPFSDGQITTTGRAQLGEQRTAAR